MTLKRTVAFAALAVLLSACDRSGQAPSGPAAVEGAKAGGTITFATGPLSSLDPQLAIDPVSQLVVRTMCDQLIEFDPKTGAAVGGLAESWTITSRGSRLVVKLRKGIRFSNGDEVTSEDVAFSLWRLASEELGSPGARIIERISGFGYVHGDVVTDRESLLNALVGVQRIDSRSFEITLDQPNAEFFKALSHPATTPISQKSFEDPTSKFVCSGPYVAKGGVVPGESLILERSSHYQGSAVHTRSGKGYADRIVFSPKDSREAAFDAFKALPETDSAQVPEQRLDEIVEPISKVEASTAQLEMIGLPTSRAPFDDPKVRRALSTVLDRELIARNVFKEGRTPALSFLDFVGGTPCPSASATAQPDEAKQLLAEAGVDLSAEALKIYFNDEFSNRALVEEVAAQWRASLGATVEVLPLNWDAFISQGRGPQGFDGAFRYAWAPEYPSAERMLFPLFDTDSIGRENLSRYSSREFRESLREARRQIDDERRFEAYKAMGTFVCEEMPVIPIVFDERTYAVKPGVNSATGELLDRSWGEPNLREWYLTR